MASSPSPAPVLIDPDQDNEPPKWWGCCCGCLLFLVSATLTVALFVVLVRAIIALGE
jgi:hypothetical protein